MGSMTQFYGAKDELRAIQVREDIYDAFRGSRAFEEDRLVVSPIAPVYDMETGDLACYGFEVYFDDVDISDIRVHVQEERRVMTHARIAAKSREQEENSSVSYMTGVLYE